MGNGLLSSQARALGISRGRLRGPGWARVSHGLYVPAGGDVVTLARQCAELTRVLPPDAAMAHLTAARLYGLWLPRLPSWLPVLVVVPPGQRRPERVGTYVFRSAAALEPHRWIGGAPVVLPNVCLGQLAQDLSLIDLVVAIDSALHSKLCTVEDIRAGIRPGQRGLPRLREAIALSDARSESPWESVLRLLHVTSGIPVEPQVVIRDSDGRFLARVDLRIKGIRRLPEYDGAGHRDRDQHQSDLAREKDLTRHEWQRYGYVAKEIIGNPGLVIRDAEDALGWPHNARRLDGWRRMVPESTLSAGGRDRLMARLHRFDRPLRWSRPST